MLISIKSDALPINCDELMAIYQVTWDLDKKTNKKKERPRREKEDSDEEK